MYGKIRHLKLPFCGSKSNGGRIAWYEGKKNITEYYLQRGHKFKQACRQGRDIDDNKKTIKVHQSTTALLYLPSVSERYNLMIY